MHSSAVKYAVHIYFVYPRELQWAVGSRLAVPGEGGHVDKRHVVWHATDLQQALYIRHDTVWHKLLLPI